MDVELFECDGCGDRFGAKNDVNTIHVRRRAVGEPLKVSRRDVHVCWPCIEDSDVPVAFIPNHVGEAFYVAIENREVIGMSVRVTDRGGGHAVYRDRTGGYLGHYEPFFEWLEEELL